MARHSASQNTPDRKRRSFWEPIDSDVCMSWLDDQSDLGNSVRLLILDAIHKYGPGDVIVQSMAYREHQYSQGMLPTVSTAPIISATPELITPPVVTVTPVTPAILEPATPKEETSPQVQTPQVIPVPQALPVTPLSTDDVLALMMKDSNSELGK